MRGCLADDGLKRDFRAWLLDPVNLAAFDRGIALIPENFLANGAIAPTPVGFDPSELQPEFGLVQGEGAVFSEADVVAALKKAAEAGVKLQNIRSPAGFERRLNDVTCAGCHQTRGIGGFHFPGVDWMADKPSNTTVVPASPHFFGDQVRRRDILQACAMASRRIIRADLPAGRSCAAAANSPAAIITTAGARIAMCRASRPPVMTRAFAAGRAPRA